MADARVRVIPDISLYAEAMRKIPGMTDAAAVKAAMALEARLSKAQERAGAAAAKAAMTAAEGAKKATAELADGLAGVNKVSQIFGGFLGPLGGALDDSGDLMEKFGTESAAAALAVGGLAAATLAGAVLIGLVLAPLATQPEALRAALLQRLGAGASSPAEARALEGLLLAVGPFAGEPAVQRDAQRELVGQRIAGVALELFGGHEAGAAGNLVDPEILHPRQPRHPPAPPRPRRSFAAVNWPARPPR